MSKEPRAIVIELVDTATQTVLKHEETNHEIDATKRMNRLLRSEEYGESSSRCIRATVCGELVYEFKSQGAAKNPAVPVLEQFETTFAKALAKHRQ
jgi:negative regulator of replication initiation